MIVGVFVLYVFEVENREMQGRRSDAESTNARASASLCCLSAILCNERTGTKSFKQKSPVRGEKGKRSQKSPRGADLIIQECIGLLVCFIVCSHLGNCPKHQIN